MASVELHQAFMWDCPECGRENFARAVTFPMTPEERAELEEEAGVNAGGCWLAAPTEVNCAHCHHQFNTENPEDFDDGID